MTAAPALAAGLPDGAKHLLRLAVAALARREHSRSEIAHKLERKLESVRRAAAVSAAAPDAGASGTPHPEPPAAAPRASPLAGVTRADIALVLDRLQSRGLLCDQRMAQVLARTRGARYGRLRIRQELERRGVDRDTIAAVLPPPEQEAAAALALWQRKFGAPPADLKDRARQGRFLAARGFAPAIVAHILRGGAEAPE